MDNVNKIPLQSDIKGIDVVTGQPATTGGPYASGNPVKPFDHPAAVEAQKRNKTGPFKDVINPLHVNVDKNQDEVAKLDAYMQAEKAKADEKAKDFAAKAPGVKPSVPVTTTPGTQAAANAGVRQPQGMNKPTVASQVINTSTVQPPPAVSPADKVAADAQGDTSKTPATEVKSS